MKIAVIHGPNLNLLGLREPSVYGKKTLKSINDALFEKSLVLGVEVEFFQSNSEGEIVDYIQLLPEREFKGIVINPAAYTHTSVAIRDAILAVDLPFVEVHLSNIFAREEFRHRSLFSDVALGVISGLGYRGYIYALDYIVMALKQGGNL